MEGTTPEIRKLTEASRNQLDTMESYRHIFGMIDLTTLEGTDEPGTVMHLCQQALVYRDSLPGHPHVAAICVYPVFAADVSKHLRGSGIRTACVAGGFPSGQMPLALRLEECRYAMDEGAEEIDMVISRGRILSGDEDFVRREIRSFAKVCDGRAHLKVILETGELREEQFVRRASRIALEEGADFLKTSTGKVQPAATLEAFCWMLEEIAHYHGETGKATGIKAAGGIAEPGDALDYYLLTHAMLGKEWLTPERLRFGASRLAGKLANLLTAP
ncbi:MAG: deoxyribose-phosphate aldolase [Bacteroidales bacterium]